MAGKPSGEALRSIRVLFNAGTVGGLTDGRLLERFTARDGEGADLAFAALVERHGPMVQRVCRSVLRDAHEAEDAFQATFLILAIKAGSIRGRDSLTSWLYSVAYNVAATARTSAARRRSHERNAGQARPLAFTDAPRDDLGPAIHEELDRIPERFRTVLVLCFLEGLTQHQAAERLGWPVGTVQSRLARGRERLGARLARRGLAPSAAVLASSLASEAAVPAALADSTVRLAVTIGGARAMAIGTVPVAVMQLVKKGVRTMFVNKLLTTGVAALLTAGVIATGAYAYQAAKPDPAAAPAKTDDPDDGLLTVSGVVRMPDGTPAAGATVQPFSGSIETPLVARTDEAGRFQLRGMFANGCNLHASSADGGFQTVRKITSVAARTELSAAVELTIQPVLGHEVVVLSEGRPAAGVQVVASGTNFQAQGVTGRDGKARLRLPAEEPLRELVAWHPTLGAGGKRDPKKKKRPREARTELSLLPPAPHTIRVVDADGKPVGGLELGVSFHPEDSDWIIARSIEASHVRTNADGTAIVPWAPDAKLQYVEVDFPGSDWKVDETDLKQAGNRLTTIHARREQAVQGRLIMPEGADARGILITGFGFGPGENGDIPYARARRDGTFTLRVPSEHGFVLGIVDLKWACAPWTGLILGKGSTRPAEITMKAYPVTPLTVRVTRGARHEPVREAWVDLSARGRVSWTDAAGKKKSGNGGVSAWLRTDADGVVRAGVGRGKHEVRLSSGDWEEKRTIEVASEKPVEVDFHRAWAGSQRITGRLTLDGAPYKPSPSLAAHAWAPPPEPQRIPIALEPVVNPDGTFEVAFDSEAASLFFFDRDRKLGGYAEGIKGDAVIDVAMTPTATYSGTLLGVDGRPAAGQTLEIYVKRSSVKPIASQRTDEAGRFRFTGVPSNVPLQVCNRHEPDGPDDSIFDGDRMFNPGEARENAQLNLLTVSFSSSNPRPKKTPPPPTIPLAKGVESLCRKVGPSGMRALVALMGDDSGDAARTVDSLLADDDERTRAVLSYLTLRVDPAQLAKEAAAVAERGWPKPAAGEIVLVALDGDQKTIAAERIAVKDVDAAIRAGADFLKQHRPPSRNAPALLAEARAEAKRSGRRVWVIQGGPRCGPCFRLARWIEDHHATLDKDYVVVKLMEGVDDRVTEALAGLPIETGDGIPWFAITEPDGAVLAHSRGPVGNIGFPSSVEGIRHFRRMLEGTIRKTSPDEVAQLIKSLSSDH
ncbi:MAG: sigma-70 family RNA polymerase sigma factor [Paludisphaera borealis]|uniref:sigma-70 family RNA polymerase sigma factor n=1 Tax=Paludisphaera borealis TaxID=1387353 RepID=UPI0028462908|nr:sigma-70 family RNA polymerase sigma factor [Paludisphaera borealis]MDR3623167.1 sigma-70 family RNA polymerase sigma factor [Paludisphaera borealis]